MRENDVGRSCCVDFEDGRMGHEPRNAGGLQKLKKKDEFSPRTSSINAALLTP